MAQTHLLKNMKINEVSLVTSPASPGADILFTKASAGHDVSGEPRDDHGRWVTWGSADLVRGSKGAARALVRALSDRAKAIGETTVARTVNAVRTTRPTGASPVHGGGVQFDFEHTLHRDFQGNTQKFLSSVQIRPEHLQGEGKGSATMRRALKMTHRVLTTANRAPVQPFGTQNRFSWLSGRYVSQGGGSYGFGGAPGGQGGVAPTSTDQNAPGGTERQTPFGMPVWQAHEVEAPWSSRIRGRTPAGPYPLANASYETAGGKAHYHNGHFVPEARPDVQRGIERVHEWLDANPARRGQAMNTVRSAYDANGSHFFTQQGDYIPPGRATQQNELVGKYHTERKRKEALQAISQAAHGPPAADVLRREIQPGGREDIFDRAAENDYPHDLSGVSNTHLFTWKEAAEKNNHQEVAAHLDREISNRARHMPSGSASGGFRAEEHLEKRLQLSGFERSPPSRTRKCNPETLEYVQRVSKSKIKHI